MADLRIAGLNYQDAFRTDIERDEFIGFDTTLLSAQKGGPLAAANFLPVSSLELSAARLTPRVIVPDYIFADVRCLIAAGGTGKTTVKLYEAIIAALGRPLWGRRIDQSKRTALITREDSREILVSRMREIIRQMHLTEDELRQVLENVRIIDLSSIPFRLSCVIDDVVMPHRVNIDSLIEQLVEFGPDWLIFDPLISFGVGEARINDAEQGLIEAFRIIRNIIGCCVEGVHHSGKANARDKALDQYAGRGGSALADGSRMVAVMQPLTPGEWEQETGSKLMDGQSGIVLALPKLSYCAQQDPIFIRRAGYLFDHESVIKRSRSQISNAIAEQVLQFIRHEAEQGRHHTGNTLQDLRGDMSLSRDEVRAAVAKLKSSGRVIPVGTPGKPDYRLVISEPDNPKRNPERSMSEKLTKKGDDE